MSEIQLLSDVGVDYTRLRNLLVAGDWLNADQETARVLLMAVGKEADSFLRDKEIEQFPCTDLRTVDQLWVYYSAKRCGFSVQSDLWKGIIRNNIKANYSTFGRLGSKLGWLTDKGWLNYMNCPTISDLKEVPRGHFPHWGLSVITWTGEATWMPGLWGLSALSAKIEGVVKVEWALGQFSILSPLCAFFSRIETCKLESTSFDAIDAIEPIQERQETISLTVTADSEKLTSAKEQLDTEGYFNPRSLKEAEDRIATSIARRQGQPKFRKDLLEAYEYRCAVTGCDAQEALEAAHIIPYCETENNAIYNGLLLRGDIHTLFDLNLIAIVPDDSYPDYLNLIAIAPDDSYPDYRESLIVHVAPSLRQTSYGELHNKPIKHLPKKKSDLPSKNFLKSRCSQCVWFR